MEKESPFKLTSMDIHTESGGNPPWNQVHVRRGIYNHNGFWVIDVAREGTYEFSLRRWPMETGKPLNASLPRTRPVPGSNGYPEGVAINLMKARIRIGDQEKEKKVDKDAMDVKFRFELSPGITRLQTWLTDEDYIERGAYYVYITQIID